MRLIILALFLLAGAVSENIFSKVIIKNHMDKLSDHRYPTAENQKTRNEVKDYIKKEFIYYGLEVHEQTFNTTVNTEPRGTGDEVEVWGTNIIGIKPAETHKAGAVVVVGADYDSDGISDPLFYNGAGVKALLEAAYVYTFTSTWSGRLKANFTTIFVAFDINTMHYRSSSGRPGGSKFVKEWLWPYIKKNADYFGGAVILDSIMNVNYEPNTQTITPDFRNLFPETYERVSQQNKGDFLAMVSLAGNADTAKLKDQYSAAFNKDRRDQRYRLEDMVIPDSLHGDPMVLQFFESEDMHFWSFVDENNTGVHLPAILLTDTSDYRNDPKESCSNCRPKDLLTEERLEFVNATVKATVHFLLDRQTTKLPEETSSTVSNLPSMVMTALMMTLVRLYM